MRKDIWLAAAAVLAVSLSLGVAIATAGGTNSVNAKACQKGGWINLQGSDGSQFNSEEECVSFGAHEGTIVPIPPRVSISYTKTFDPAFCYVAVNLSHFAPNTSYAVDVLAKDRQRLTPYGPYPVTTDSSGAGVVGIFSYIQRPGGLTAVDAAIGSVSSGYQPIAC